MRTQGLQLAVEEQGFISLMWFYMVGGISRDFLAPVTIAVAIGMPAQLPLAHTLPALGTVQVVPLFTGCAHYFPRSARNFAMCRLASGLPFTSFHGGTLRFACGN